MLSITPLDGNFGVAVRGIDIAAGTDGGTMLALSEALYENLVVCIKDQSLAEEQYLRFGRRWGTPIPHVLDHMRMPGYPELLTVGNTERRDEDEKIRNGAALWHTDQSYEAVPASATMLYSIRAPARGGETRYCNMVAAYDALDEAVKSDIDGLMVAHKYGRGQRRADEPPANPIVNDDQDNRVPPVYHRLARPHPITGRVSLYALGHGAYGIRGMADDEAGALIERLKDHCLEERFIYRHRYEVGDLVIWDTSATMHAATPIGIATDASDSRLLWRISVRGAPDVNVRAAVIA